MESINALIYARVSSERQKKEGHGLESQEHRCREYARQKGYVVEEAFLDSFTGGGDFMRRPAMVELLKYIDKYAHKKYVVIFDDLSRLARDVGTHISLRLAFKQRGVALECPNFNFTDTDESELVELVLAAQNQYFRKANRRQVIQKQKARLEKGYWPFYPVPGYTMGKDPVHGKLLMLNDKAKIVKEALEGFASGRLPAIVDVQKFLEDKRFRDGGPVYLQKAKGLLQRIIYAGYIEYQPWGVVQRKGHHEGIISLACYEKIQERLRGGAKTLIRRDVNEEFPLRGFVLCSKCRRPNTASRVKGRGTNYWSYYRCNKKECSEYNLAIAKKDVEDSFENILRSKAIKNGVLRLVEAVVLDVWDTKEKERIGQKSRQEKEITTVRAERDGLMVRVAKATDEKVVEAYEGRIGELTKREQLLEEEIEGKSNHSGNFETALAKVLEFIKNPMKTWETGDIQNRRLVLRLIFREKLAYDRLTGFETAKFSIPMRVSECSLVSKYQGVEVGILKSRPKVSAVTLYKLRSQNVRSSEHLSFRNRRACSTKRFLFPI